MKLSRLEAFLKGKVTDIKTSSRLKRVNAALESAKINFEEEMDKANFKREKLLEELAVTDDVTGIITLISDCINDIENAQKGINRINEISRYFKETIEVED